MTAKIIKFPDKEIAGAGAACGDDGSRTCDRCVHFLCGVSGEYCRALGEDVMSVSEAEDCDLYET